MLNKTRSEDQNSAFYGSNLYTARVSSDFQDRNGRPCNACIKMMIEYGIKKVYYTDGETIKIEKVNKMKLIHQSEGSKLLTNLKNK